MLLPVIVSAQYAADTIRAGSERTNKKKPGALAKTRIEHAVEIMGEGMIEVAPDTVTAYIKIKGNIYDKNYYQSLDALCETMLTELKIKKIAKMTSKDDEAPPRFSRKYNISFSSIEEYNEFRSAALEYAEKHQLDITTRLRDAGLKPSTVAAAKTKIYSLALEDAKAKSATISKVYNVQLGEILEITEAPVPDDLKLHKAGYPSLEENSEAFWAYYEMLASKKKISKKANNYQFFTVVHVTYSLK